ncbi:hypothetical protein RHGRI_017141 [Rhododendron griersonianum]|uniref:Exostosin GT47 domain-containing protein n=1 Tax=Rhododendron griersonianum TaxID=479676 RepID=A0AAV6JWP8_9ERIC|nr:hypothetical protein RHGRI_017141 [Rhododendron griersonianum]
MPPKNTTTTTLCSVPSLFISLSLLCILSLSLFLLLSHNPSPSLHSQTTPTNSFINVYVADLPRSLNYGLLDQYWSLTTDTRLGSESDNQIRSARSWNQNLQYPSYPENPIIKQYSAEYWITGDLMTTPGELRTASFARRVFDYAAADVVFVPFFATMSAEMQLGVGKGVFRKKEGNEDYERQRQVVDFVKGSEAWKRSGGCDHVFVLTDPVAMWHVRAEISPAVLLVVDFGGWYRLDSKASSSNSSDMIQHTQGGMVREKLWDLLVNEPGVVMEEGFPNATGKEQSIKGMRTSEFCLHPAGDTPTSCRLFDAIQSLCIPVIVSDNIELPFEGMVDYSEFSVFVAVTDALQPNWLVRHLRSYSDKQKNIFRQNMAQVQPVFEYDNGHPGGIGHIPFDGAVNFIWKKVHQKLPMIKEAIIREKRKPPGVSVPLRCHCT